MNLFFLHQPVIFGGLPATIEGQFNGQVIIRFDDNKDLEPPVVYTVNPDHVQPRKEPKKCSKVNSPMTV